MMQMMQMMQARRMSDFKAISRSKLKSEREGWTGD